MSKKYLHILRLLKYSYIYLYNRYLRTIYFYFEHVKSYNNLRLKFFYPFLATQSISLIFPVILIDMNKNVINQHLRNLIPVRHLITIGI